MEKNYIDKIVKKILKEAEETTTTTHEGLKKLQDAVKSGCLKNGKIRADKAKEMSTGEYPSGTNFYYYFTSTSGNVYLIRPNLSIYDYTNKKDLGRKINCPQVTTTQSASTADTKYQKIDVDKLKPIEFTPKNSVLSADTVNSKTKEDKPQEVKGETGEQIFKRLNANYASRTKPFINVDRTRVVFKGDVGTDIDSTTLEKLNKFIESTYMMSLEKARGKSGNEIKYVWTTNEYNNRYKY